VENKERGKLSDKKKVSKQFAFFWFQFGQKKKKKELETKELLRFLKEMDSFLRYY
jgi:hypothetical protein